MSFSPWKGSRRRAGAIRTNARYERLRIPVARTGILNECPCCVAEVRPHRASSGLHCSLHGSVVPTVGVHTIGRERTNAGAIAALAAIPGTHRPISHAVIFLEDERVVAVIFLIEIRS